MFITVNQQVKKTDLPDTQCACRPNNHKLYGGLHGRDARISAARHDMGFYKGRAPRV